jgi:16S rRNA (cytidine1402-2'-O)-methyltransferase
MGKGTLYLVPSGLGASHVSALLAPATLEVLHRLEHFIAERPKSARAFLRAAQHPRALQELAIETLDEHTPATAISALLAPLEQGTDCALLAEAGCPAIADPGALLVRRAHAARIRVVPLVGPSAILLALMSAGMNGQRFAFHGYLPVDRAQRARRIAALEDASEQHEVTQVFIEAPYRNHAMFQALVHACLPDTLLCLATDLTLDTESIRTLTISDWKAQHPELQRRPTVFLLYREKPRPGRELSDTAERALGKASQPSSARSSRSSPRA